MKFLWYLTSISTILLILINSPKTTSISSFIDQSKFMNLTNDTQILLQKIIILNILLFLILTIFYIIYASI